MLKASRHRAVMEPSNHTVYRKAEELSQASHWTSEGVGGCLDHKGQTQ